MLAVGLAVILYTVLPPTATALEGEITSIPTDFSDETPLQITGFQWGAESMGTQKLRVLRYIQLYNNSATPVSLGDWSVMVQTLDDTGTPTCTVDTCQKLVLPMKTDGLLAPNQHLVIDDGETVSGAWKGLADIVVKEFTKSKASVQFVMTSPGIQTSAVTVKVDTAIDSLANYTWSRNLSSTGSGYLSTFTVSATQPATLFNDELYTAPDKSDARIVEIYPYASDCPPEDTSVLCRDYIKIFVGDMPSSVVDKLVVRTDSGGQERTLSNTLSLAGLPETNGYMTISKTDKGMPLSLTNSGGYIWIEDTYGLQRYGASTSYPSATSQWQGASYIVFPDGAWAWTVTPMPDGDNVLTLPTPKPAATCPDGKYLNPDTNRCRTVEEAVNALATCPEGQERNPTTNRCRSIETATPTVLPPCDEGYERNPATNRCRSTAIATTVLTPCGEGQERNPATNRCRSIASAVAELLPCDEGYERNPATNRCRKVLSATTTVPSKNVTQETKNTNETDTSGLLSWVILGIVVAGVAGYGVYEWRDDISAFGKKLSSRFKKK